MTSNLITAPPGAGFGKEPPNSFPSPQAVSANFGNSNTTADTNSGISNPEREAFTEIADILVNTAKSNWDSYGAIPVTWKIADALFKFVQGTVRGEGPVPWPQFGPTPRGGLTAEWEAARGLVNLTFEPGRSALVEYVFDDEESEWELTSPQDSARLARSLWLLFAAH